MNEQKQRLPIGYWVKKVDRLLTEKIESVQQLDRISRIDWQVLNTLSRSSPQSITQLASVLEPFASVDQLERVTDELRERGLIVKEEATGLIRLTEEGEQLHTRALERQRRVRRQAVAGLSEADYATTIRVLQQIVKNLESGELNEK